MKNALILTGWCQKTTDNWYPWLKKELERKAYRADLPDLPTIHTDMPDLQKILKFIENQRKFEGNSLVIGHSLGCLIALRLAEKHRIGKIILVSGWDFDDLTEAHKLFWKTKIDHAKINRNVKKVIVLHSDNDPYISAFQAEEMSKRLNGKFVLVKGAGHFTSADNVNKLPQLIQLI